MIGHDRSNYELKNMRMLTAYVDRSALSFEIYDAGSGAVGAIADVDASKRRKVEKSQFKFGNVKVSRAIQRSDKYYYARQYFASNGKIYILTAISREKETPAAARFLNSVQIAPNDEKLDVKDSILMSQLKMTDIIAEQDLSPTPAKPASKPVKPKADEPGVLPFVILSMPRASYTPDARNHGVEGAIRVRVTLAADGYVPKIVVIGKALPAGLLRNVLYSAIRLKFLPKERNGVPESVSQTFEYAFSIY